MSLIKSYTNDLAGLKEKFADDLVTNMNINFNSVKAMYESNMQKMWQTAFGLNPKNKFDALGTKAAQLFTIASATAQMLNAINPSYVPSTPETFGWTQATEGTVSKTYIINQDGSVTVNL
jgi:hypothetical protein